MMTLPKLRFSDRLFSMLVALSIFLVFMPAGLIAQTCGIHLTGQPAYLPAPHSEYSHAARSGMRTILLKAYIVRDDMGNDPPGLSYPALVAAVEGANTYFTAFDLRFEVACEPVYIDDSALQYPGVHFDSTANNLDDPAYINTYLMTLSGAGGYGFYPGNKSRVILGVLTPQVVAHELGHTMGLIHTFGPGFGGTDELVDGSNCLTAGDRICDTPADPYPLGLFPGTSCIYNDTVLTDANGQLYNPLTDNIMSYNLPNCQNSMTAGQGQFMNFIESTERFYYASDTTGLRVQSFPGSICLGDLTDYPLTSNPAGGIFSGPGITNNVLNASGLSAGTYSVTLTFNGSVGDSALITDAAQIANGLVTDTNHLWQSYRAIRGGEVEKVHFRFANATAETVQLKVYNGIGTGGSVLMTESFAVPADSTIRWVELALASPYIQSTGQLYTLELTAQNANLSLSYVNNSIQFGAGVSNVQQPSSAPVTGLGSSSWTYVVACLTNDHHCSNGLSFDFQVTQPSLWYGIPQELNTKYCKNGVGADLRGFGYYPIDSVFVNGQLADSIYPSQLDTGEQQLLYKIKDNYGCWHALDTTVTVVGFPVVGLDSVMCSSDPAIDLSALHPQGSFWINGVQNSVFEPSVLGPGVHSIEAHIPNVFDTTFSEFRTLQGSQENIFKSIELNETIGQSFVGDSTGFLSELTILTFIGAYGTYAGSTIPLEFELRKGTSPTGLLLISDTFHLPDTFATMDYSVNDYSNILIEKDSGYTVYFHRLDSGAINNVQLRAENTGAIYTGGELFDNGIFNPGEDLSVKVKLWHEEHCGEEQTVEVVLSDIAPNVDLPDDPAQCDSIVLSAGTAPNYLWSNGSTDPSITVFASGLYWVELSNGCTASDSTNVTIHPPTMLTSILGNSMLVADSAYTFSVLPTTGSNYTWSTTTGQIVSGQGSANVSILWPAATVESIQVEETTSEGCTGEPAIMNITVEEPQGISSSVHSTIEIYPNPASTSVTIKLGREEAFTVAILDVNGQVVSQSRDLQTLDLGDLANGLYFMQVTTQSRSANLRLVVQR